MNIHPLRRRDHEDAARVAISWLAERHRKGWRSAFEALRPAVSHRFLWDALGISR